jgi:serine protease Do
MDKMADVAKDFVLLHLDKIQGIDLRLFDFDFDLTFAVFFLNADEQIYGRYGSRDAKSAEDQMSLAGLRYAMQAALQTHRNAPRASPAAQFQRPILAENYASLRTQKGCIHCHQIWEARRLEAQNNGTLKRDDFWIYPHPENVGLTLEVDQGDKVLSVAADSPADKAGIRAGDTIESINGISVNSIADARYALHRAPLSGASPISWQQNTRKLTAELQLQPGWRKTNPTWRPSMLDILPATSMFGEDLAAQEKRALGLTEKRLAFRQEDTIRDDLKKLGIQGGDIIIGINNEVLELTMIEFLGHIRRNFILGERITLNVIRNGQRVDLPGTF